MNWNDLTKEQQARFHSLVDAFGEPIKDATHFHTNGMNRWFLVKDDEVFWWDDQDTKRWWKECKLGGVTRTLGFSITDLVEIPDKPWYDPADVAFNQEEPMQDSNIGKWFRVNVSHDVYRGHVGECVDEDVEQGTILLKFTHKGKEWWSLTNVELSDKTSSETCVIKKPSHYQLLPEYEVKDVIKALLDKIESSEYDMTYYEAGFFQQSMQYFMRFYAKNGLEDLKKGVETMQFVIDSMEECK